MPRPLFFFYGTLTHEHDNAVTRAVLPLLRRIGPAAVRGRVLAVARGTGWYPVLHQGRGGGVGGGGGGGEGWVHGWVYAAGPRFHRRALRLLDAWEDADARRPGRSEYVRVEVNVRIGRRVVRAQAYRHNRPAHPGLKPIAGGSFAAFLSRCGRRAVGTR
jgi:gamma-glutamylcyclotransferase (GGCT)/AIG2-like uncharacterized protein YtfP